MICAWVEDMAQGKYFLRKGIVDYRIVVADNQSFGIRRRIEEVGYTLRSHDMWRTTLFFMLGIFGTALFGAAISVYMLHDVDRDKIGHWNEAFVGLCAESVVFTLIVGGGVALLTLLGRHLFHLRGYSPRAMLGLFLGIGLIVLQYPWEFAVRKRLPKLADTSLYLYLVVAISFCAVIIVRDNFKQMKLGQAPAESFDN